ncbi:MAG: hypothetical protein FWD31_03425, partial [Planctomycetaceae bacterium]|nr:hypothetical protein [Planctomycetaceae bacterium]
MKNFVRLCCCGVFFCLISSVVAKAGAPPTQMNPPPVKIVYFIPSDCQAPQDRQERLGRVMKHVQEFYRHGMESHGYGQVTFNLEWESADKLKLYEVQGKKTQAEYGRNDYAVVRNEVRDALRSQGMNIDREVIVIFQLLLKWEDGKATELGPYVGSGTNLYGTAWVYDDALLDAA